MSGLGRQHRAVLLSEPVSALDALLIALCHAVLRGGKPLARFPNAADVTVGLVPLETVGRWGQNESPLDT